MCLAIDGVHTYMYTRFARVRTFLSFPFAFIFLTIFCCNFPPCAIISREGSTDFIVYNITFLRKSSTNGARYVKVSHVRRLAHESAMDLVAPGIEDVRAAYKKQENSRGVGWPRRGKEGKKRRSTLVAYIFYGAITSNPYLRFVQFCPSVQPSLFLTFSSSPLLTAYCFLPG